MSTAPCPATLAPRSRSAPLRPGPTQLACLALAMFLAGQAFSPAFLTPPPALAERPTAPAPSVTDLPTTGPSDKKNRRAPRSKAEADAPKARVVDEPRPAPSVPADAKAMLALQVQVQEVVRKCMPSVVSVEVGGSRGSGVIVTPDGYVMTAGHVSGPPGRKARIVLADGRSFEARALSLYPSVDAGMMKIDASGPFPCLDIGRSDTLKPGHWCVALGHPGGRQTDRPAVARIGRIILASDLVIHTDATLVGGDSGGPLLDLSGRVIGIHSRIAQPITANLHVPSDVWVKDWRRMLAGETIGPQTKATANPPPQVKAGGPYMGLAGRDHPRGVVVTSAALDTPAGRAGLREGDLITAYQLRPVQGFEPMFRAIQSHKPGDHITLTVERDGMETVFKVKLGQRPAEEAR